MKRKCQKIYEKMTKEQFIEKLLKEGYTRSFIDHYLTSMIVNLKNLKRKGLSKYLVLIFSPAIKTRLIIGDCL